MATNHKVGGEIDAFCNKDKMTLAHTIIAMVGEKVARVQCNTCGSQHAYRGTAPAAKKPRASKSAEPKVSKITRTFDELMSGKDAASAKKYSAKETYAQDDLIDHPSFGFGIVQEARADKVTVLFKMDEKTLVHGRGGAPAAKPAFSAPRTSIKGPADKPMPEGAAPAEGSGGEGADEVPAENADAGGEESGAPTEG